MPYFSPQYRLDASQPKSVTSCEGQQRTARRAPYSRLAPTKTALSEAAQQKRAAAMRSRNPLVRSPPSKLAIQASQPNEAASQATLSTNSQANRSQFAVPILRDPASSTHSQADRSQSSRGSGSLSKKRLLDSAEVMQPATKLQRASCKAAHVQPGEAKPRTAAEPNAQAASAGVQQQQQQQLEADRKQLVGLCASQGLPQGSGKAPELLRSASVYTI